MARTRTEFMALFPQTFWSFSSSPQLHRSVVHVKTWKLGVDCKIKASDCFMHLLKYEYPAVERRTIWKCCEIHKYSTFKQTWFTCFPLTAVIFQVGALCWLNSLTVLTGDCSNDRSADFIASLAGFHCVGASATSYSWDTAVAPQSLCWKTNTTVQLLSI